MITSFRADYRTNQTDQPDARAPARPRDRARSLGHASTAAHSKNPGDAQRGADINDADTVASLYAFMLEIDNHIRAFDQKIEAIFKDSEVCPRIARIRGIGPRPQPR